MATINLGEKQSVILPLQKITDKNTAALTLALGKIADDNKFASIDVTGTSQSIEGGETQVKTVKAGGKEYQIWTVTKDTVYYYLVPLDAKDAAFACTAYNKVGAKYPRKFGRIGNRITEIVVK